MRIRIVQDGQADVVFDRAAKDLHAVIMEARGLAKQAQGTAAVLIDVTL